MSYTIDDSTIEFLKYVGGAVGSAIAVVAAWFWRMLQKGYVKIWLSKIFTSTEEILALKSQNGKALAKLNTNDDLFCVLESFDIDDNGNVVLKGKGRVNNLLNETRPLTTYEKDEIIRAVRSVLRVKKE